MSTGTMNERIGFIGVGLMGHGMAKNIVEKGYPLTVMGHRNRAPVEDLVGRGASEAKSAKDVAAASTIVFICVTGSPEVEAIVRGPNGLKDGLKPGSIVVDCSTADPNSTLALAAELAAIGATMVDAPLSRTPKEAWEGTLDTMVGATPEIFARLKPVLDTWAGRVIHIGATADGHRMKLLNNFIAMGYAALYSEALTLAQKVGITPERFDSVIRAAAWIADSTRRSCAGRSTRTATPTSSRCATPPRTCATWSRWPTRRGWQIPWGTPSRTATRSPWPPAALTTTCRCSRRRWPS